MNMGDFRDANLSFLATPWRKVKGMFASAAERKRAEEALRAAERKYRDIFENALEAIFQTTPDGRFISANPALVKILGFSSAEELIRERAEISNQHYVDPKRRDEFKQKMDEQGVVKGFELQAYRKDGSTIWLSENVRTVRDEVGKVLYYEGTAWDITERRRANHSLRLFRTLIDQSSDAIEVIDPATLRFLDCNESAYQDLGYGRAEFLSLSVYDIDPLVDERMAARLTEEMDRSGFVIFESIHRRKDGSTFPVEINLKTVRLERDYRLAVVRDITERKVAEEALRNAERKYRDIFENAGEGIFQSTPDGRFIAANPALARMHGFASPEELIHSCQDISREVYVDPTRREEFKHQLEEEGAVRGFEHQLFRKDGSKIWISVNARAVRDEQSEIQYYEGTAQDITDRKRAEEALRESEERYRDLVENSRELICTHDLDGLILSANRAATEVLGHDREDYFGKKNLRELLTPEALEGFEDYLARIRNDGVASGTMLVQTSSGEHRIWEYYNTLRTEGVAAPIVRGMARDVTERKRAEEGLRQSAQDFRNLFEQAHDAIIVLNPEHEIVLDVNERACEVYGFTRSEFVGMSLEAISKDVVRGKNMVGKTLERGEYLDFETVQYRKDGTEMFLEINASTILYQGQLVILSINRDITERKRSDEKLQNSEKYFRSLIENASDLITISDGHGIIRYESPSLERMLGYKPEERMGKSVLDLLHPDDLSFAKRHFAKGIQNPGIVHVMECRFQHKDGSWHLLETTGINLLDDPVVAGIVVNSRDITERKRAEHDLIKQKEILQKIVDHIPVMINFTDSDGRIKLVNREWQQTLGWSLEDILNADLDVFAECYPDPQYRQEAWNFVTAATGEWGDFKTRTRDGSTIETSWARVKLSDGTTLGIGQDITARKRAEQGLLASERKYRDIFAFAPVGIYQSLRDGTLITVNKALAKMLGYASVDELLRVKLGSGMYFAEDEREKLIRKYEGLGYAVDLDVQWKRKDSSPIWVQLSAHAIKGSNGETEYFEGFVSDITERKAAEEKLKATRDQLRALSARLQSAREEEGTRIAREIHDELGSVLTSLKWDLEGTDRILAGPMEPSQLAALREKLHALMKLTDGAVSTIRRIASELRPSVLDDLGLAAAIEWQAQQFQARTGIVCYCDCSLENVELGEEQSTAVFRILQEALTNVLRHARATRVDIKINKESGYFTLSISDNGKGIAESEKSEQQSLGILGMRERAHLIGGEIDIKGVEGKATVIIVRVPISGRGRVLK